MIIGTILQKGAEVLFPMIMGQLNTGGKKLLVVGALVLAAMGMSAKLAWNYQENKYERTISDLKIVHVSELAQISYVGTKAREEQQTWYENLLSALHDQNNQFYEAYTNVQSENEEYRRRLAVGTERVFVYVKADRDSGGSCNGMHAGTGTGSVVDAGRRTAELDPTSSQFIAGLTAEGDQGISKLQGCRAWAKKVYDEYQNLKKAQQLLRPKT